MKNKKSIMIVIILIIVFLLYIAIFLFIKGLNPTTKGIIIVSELGGYSCNNLVCAYKSIEELDTDNKQIKTYQNNKYIGTYELDYLERWNFFENKKWKSLYGDFLGIEDSLNAKLLDYQTHDITNNEKEMIKDILKKNEIEETENFDSQKVIVADLDSNNEDDKIFAITNQGEESNSKMYFSLLLIILNNKNNIIYLDTSKEEYTLPFYNVFSILKLDDEKNARLIINKGYYDNVGTSSIIMLQKDGKKMKEVVKDSSK